jgi:GxxExxY protein
MTDKSVTTVQSVNQTSEAIIGAAIEVHKHLGPGLLESAYEACLCHEFNVRNIPFQRQVSLPVVYKGVKLDCGYRIDLPVKDDVFVEVKAMESNQPIHEAQTLTHMRLGGWKVGLIINFNVPIVVKGVKRLVLGLKE